MPRLVLSLVMATLLLAGTAVQAQSQNLPTPLGLRGINLGMTQAEVSKLRHPDADQQKSDAEIGLACAGDLIGIAIGLGLPPSDYAELGIKICRFYIDNKDGPRELPMNVGGGNAALPNSGLHGPGQFRWSPGRLSKQVRRGGDNGSALQR